MAQTITESLKSAISNRWPHPPGKKARRYVGVFFDRSRTGRKIVAKVEGNHGTYTVSIEANSNGRLISSACSCYIGRDGGCHHCQAFGITFLENPKAFKTVRAKSLKKVDTLEELGKHLGQTTLEQLLRELKAKGITQKAFAESREHRNESPASWNHQILRTEEPLLQ